MSLTVVLNGALEALDHLGTPPPRISTIVRPHLDQAKQILGMAMDADVDEIGANETALVAHSCVLSALARAREAGASDEHCRYARRSFCGTDSSHSLASTIAFSRPQKLTRVFFLPPSLSPS
jgi:hypothetical protein